MRSRTWRGVVLLLVGLLTLAGCAGSRASQTAEAPKSAAMPGIAPAAQPAPGAQAPSGGTANSAAYDASQAQAADAQRMIVRTGEISLVVASVEEARDNLDRLARAVGGYVANANLFRGEGDQLRGSIQLRVPAERWDEVLGQVKALGREEGSRYGTNDVTEEYTDLGARLRNLEATERELLQLLATTRDRGGKAEDIVAIYRELSSIRGQIEQLKGRMQFLEKSVSLATLTVNLTPNPVNRPLTDAGWTPAQTLRDAQRALVRTLQGLGDAAIWFVVWGLPVLLVLGIPLAVLVWLVRRWRHGRRAPLAKQP